MIWGLLNKKKTLNTSIQTFLGDRLHVPWTHFLPLTIVPPKKTNEKQTKNNYAAVQFNSIPLMAKETEHMHIQTYLTA